MLISCPASLPTEDMALVVFKLGQPLPDPWAPSDSMSLYLGLAVDSTASTKDDRTDAFHLGTDSVITVGFGDKTRVIFNDRFGDPTKQPVVALLPKLGLGAVGVPVASLRNGFRPFAAIAGPQGVVETGAWDQVAGPDGPTSLMYPFQALTPADDPLLKALGITTDPKSVAPTLTTFYDRPKDGFHSDPAGVAGVFTDPVDMLWSSGTLLAPGATASLDSTFPCDKVNAAGAFTACAPGVATASGPFAVLRGVFGGPIPLKGTDKLVYGAVFDGDGKPATAWPASADFPNDTYQGTDQWFEATYDPATDAWTVATTKVGDGALERGNATATSGARFIIDGSTATWLIPTSEFAAPLPSWRLTSAITTDGSFSPATTGVDVSSGGPGSSWALQPLADPTGLIQIVVPEPAVTGGCVTVVPMTSPTPVALGWTIDFVGLEDIDAPTLEMTIFYDGFSAKSTVVLGGGDSVTFQFPVQPSKVRFDKLLVNGGKKPIDLTKSWHALFGKGINASNAGAHAGPDCS